MIFVYLQTVSYGKHDHIPYRISYEQDGHTEHLNFRPGIAIPNKVYQAFGLDRLSHISAPPFCDIADYIIDQFKYQAFTFLHPQQFKLLKSLFSTIGYQFHIKPQYVYPHVPQGAPRQLESNMCPAHSPLLIYQTEFATRLLASMSMCNVHATVAEPQEDHYTAHRNLAFNYKSAAGIYYFLDQRQHVIYVGKAKNLRKRLQSHFSNRTDSNIDYSAVKEIQVSYSGSEILAELMETEAIKTLKPRFNTQQVEDALPFTINRGKTAKGIEKLQISRKAEPDHLAEHYFNRQSVKEAVEIFCSTYDLCTKHCGLERVKGPCSKVTLGQQNCVCNNEESVEAYNFRFDRAYHEFQARKINKIYKLPGRHPGEDGFIYLRNGIYEGYGFVEKEDPISTVQDIIGHLVAQKNNYETARIVAKLEHLVPAEKIIWLKEDD